MIAITQFIRIDRRKSDPLYLQITYQFINAVKSGVIEEGVKLPGTRVWSEQLGVHRKTVTAAFEELESQNWIRIQPKVGAFVENPIRKIKQGDIHSCFGSNIRDKSPFQFNQSYILTSPFQKRESRIVCNDGQPDYRIFKTKELSRFYSGALKRRNIELNIGDYAVQENEFFKEQLSGYLNLTRGLRISKDQLLIAKSRGMLFYTLVKMLFKKNDVVLVGELSLFSLNMVLNHEKVNVKTIPVDRNGMDVSQIRKKYKKGEIRCVYLNPDQAYPTTYSLTEKRREELLILAEELDFVIIEDSEDFEFNYQKQINLPLAFENSRVIHLGSIAKHLHPSFQLSFMMAPIDFINESKKHVSALNPQGNFVLEQALGEMIAEGDLFRYQRKALKVYHERLLLFESLLLNSFGETICFVKPRNGFAFWIEFKEHISLINLARELKSRDVFLPRICMYQNKRNISLRLGFAHWNHEEMKEFIVVFKESYDAIKKMG